MGETDEYVTQWLTDGFVHGWVEGWVDGKKGGWMVDRWTDEWMYIRMNGNCNQILMCANRGLWEN